MRVLAAAALALVAVAPFHAADPTLADLLAGAGTYVRHFEQDFALVVSDEEYQQRASGRIYVSARTRHTRAEMAFLWMPDEGAWLTVRNVVNVDGRPVADSSTRMNDALAGAAERRARLRRLLNENARFNLGRIERNFNYPTLVLSYLDPVMQPRFVFALAGHEHVNGVEAWKLTYEEQTQPTVIRENGSDRFSRGAVWIDPRDGTIVRTRLDLRIPMKDTVATVEVDYGRDAKLEMWVPVRMHETYLQSRATMINESIDCTASYSNFRRFETSGRIVTPR
jgi:hypothetical protein